MSCNYKNRNLFNYSEEIAVFTVYDIILYSKKQDYAAHSAHAYNAEFQYWARG